MSRARGRPSLTMIDIGWPHQVALPPANGTLGMARGEWMSCRVPAGDGEHRDGRYAFRTKEQADAFMAEFGGRYVNATPKSLRR